MGIIKIYLKRTLEKAVEARHKMGLAPRYQVAAAQAQTLGIRIELLREEAKLPPAKDR